MPVKKLIKLNALVSALIAAVVVAAWITVPPELAVPADFSPMKVAVRSDNWFDFGVADIDFDGVLEIHSSNHNSPQTLVNPMAIGEKPDSITAVSFAQDPDFPGLEGSPKFGGLMGQGLHIYWHDRDLIFEAPETRPTVFTGQIRLESDVDVAAESGFEVTTDSHGRWTTIHFTATSPSRARFEPRYKSVPIFVKLHESVALSQVFVGHLGVHPKSHEFQLYLRDRHGVAWADINGDDRLDAYITRGGLFGEISRFDTKFFDELLLSDGNDNWSNHGPEMGLSKDACPGRQVQWVDMNNDGRLDIYVSCSRPGSRFENQAFIRQDDGRFKNDAASLGLALAEDGVFGWFDSDDDGDSDMVWSSAGLLTHYRNVDGRFVATPLANPSRSGAHKLTIADFDNDGDLDAFAAATFGSRLLVNESGDLSAMDASDFGLPEMSKTANWIDFDNDGLTDIHIWPDGLFRQVVPGRFEKSSVLQVRSPYWWFVEPRCIWFDADNDGDRDLLLAQRYFPRPLQEAFSSWFPFSVVLLRNDTTNNNHWLNVELRGPRTNRSSIGARVTVKTQTRIQTQLVGQANGAHFSQGHYRLYFGLGRETEPTVEVRWPDGFVEQFERVAVDRLLRVAMRMDRQ
jgi:hypothetical protein